nr:hypothetical protein [Desulfosarcinaceae bacterium]
MTPAVDLRQHLTLVKDPNADRSRQGQPVSLTRLAELLEMKDPRSEAYAATLPFAKGDTTAGVENELQTVVCGDQQQVDLPLVIRNSNYFKNITAKTRTG